MRPQRRNSATGGALLIAGTTSDAGKSMVVAGLCRLLARKGIRVAPFKAQNMSNNSVVTVDGGEIGRAQGVQARAAGLAPSTRFNPVLLKPGSDRTSQLVVRGRPVGTVSAADYIAHRDELAGVVADELACLRAEFDVVLCEGAGSPAEINLRATDLANMGLARAANLPVVVVGDIDRGGLLAHLFGTVAVLCPEDQALIAGFVVNKFRGDPALLAPGLDQFEALTGRPTYGVVPFSDELWLDAEDSVSVVARQVVGVPAAPRGEDWLRVAAIRLPRISNSTDVEALACEPGVLVRWATDPAEVADADVVVIPGSKATVADLQWLRERGLADAVHAHARSRSPGPRYLRRLPDAVPAHRRHRGNPRRHGGRPGPAGCRHRLRRREGAAALGRPAGRLRDPPRPGHAVRRSRLVPGRRFAAGVRPRRGVRHALARSAGQRRFPARLVRDAAAAAGRPGFRVADDVSVPARRDAQLDVMADLLAAHLDVDAVLGLLDGGPPVRPTITSALRR